MNNIELKTSDPIYNLEVKRANVIVGSGSSVDVVWGSIVGDISQQTDLQDELNGIKEQVKEDIADKADRSELDNLATKEELSSGLLGKADKENTYTKEEVDDKIAGTDLSNYYTKQEIDEKGFITNESDPTVPEWAKQSTKPSYSADEIGAIAKGGLKTINGQTLEGNGNIEITTSGTVDSALSDTSENPVQNKVIKEALDGKQPIGDYATKSEIANLASKDELPTKVSELENDNNYIITETDPTVPAWAKEANKPKYTAAEVGALPADTVIPDISNLATKDELNAKQDILVSGTNIKTINGNSLLGNGNIEITTGGSISVDDSLSLDSENPVQNKIITEALDGKQNTGNYALRSDVPTKLSELDNDINFVDNEDLNRELAMKQDLLVNETNIKSLNGQSLLGSGSITIETPDVNKAYVDEELNKKADKTAISDMLTKTEASTTYQPIGDYALSSALDGKADKASIPTKVSQLQNDSKYITEESLTDKDYATNESLTQGLAGKADIDSIPTNVSQLNNDSGYLTEIPSEYITESELNAKDYATSTELASGLSGKQDKGDYALKSEIPDVSGLATKSELTSSLNGKVDKEVGKSLIADTEIERLSTVTNYNDTVIKADISELQTNKADKTEIPTNVSQLTNDSGYITSTVADSTYINKSQITFSTSEPSGGSDGDIWFVYE